jgi:hypothetical protein
MVCYTMLVWMTSHPTNAWYTGDVVLERLLGVFRLYRGAGLEALSRVIPLYDYYCIAIGAKLLSVLMLKEGPWEGRCLGVKEMDWLGA